MKCTMKIPRDTVAVCQLLSEVCEHLGITADFSDYVTTGAVVDTSKSMINFLGDQIIDVDKKLKRLDDEYVGLFTPEDNEGKEEEEVGGK